MFGHREMLWQTTRISPFLKNPEALFPEVIAKLIANDK